MAVQSIAEKGEEVNKVKFKHMLSLKGGVKRRQSTRFITTFDKGEPIVGMVTFKGKVLVATTGGVYEVHKKYPRGKKRITFEVKPKRKEPPCPQ